MTKRAKSILAILTVVYLLGYLGLRESHVIIHRSSYYTDPEGVMRTSSHFVQTSGSEEAEPSLGTVLAQLGIAFVYLPPIVAERMYWLLAVPMDSEWPYTLAPEE
jgi:hypothetical protein